MMYAHDSDDIIDMGADRTCTRCGKTWSTAKGAAPAPSCVGPHAAAYEEPIALNEHPPQKVPVPGAVLSVTWRSPPAEVLEEMCKGLPDHNPKTRMGALKIPLHLVPPSALHALAIAFEDGAEKYGPFNFRDSKVSATVYYGAMLRHVFAWFDGEDFAQDSEIEHLHHAMACIAILIDAKSVGMLNDNRPTKGASSDLQCAYLEKKR